MKTPVCALLLVLTQCAWGDFCEKTLRTKVENGTILGDGSLRAADGTLYPKRTFWKEDDVWMACPCLSGLCIRVCSQELANTTVNTYSFDPAPQSKRIRVWDGEEERWVLVNRHFKVIHDPFCPFAYPLEPETMEMDKHKVFSNGTLFFEHPNITEEYRLASVDQFCIIPRDGEDQIVMSCNFENGPPNDFKFRLYPYFFILSSIFLLLTLIAFFLTPDHNTLHGRSVVCQSGSLLIMYIGLTANYLTGETNHISFCIVIAYITYYFLLASFFWLNVMCIDIFLTFRSVIQRQEINFIYPSLYAWGIPALFTIVTISLDTTTNNDVFSPGIGEHRCWFQGFVSELLYFNGPVLILLLLNVYLFGRTAFTLYRLKKESKAALKGGDSRVHTAGGHSQHDRDRLVLYIKLFLLMGVTWIMEIISWAAGGPSSIWFITDTVNALRGVLIFWFCVWSNKSIRKSIKDKFFGANKPTQKATYSSKLNENSNDTDNTGTS